MNRGRPSDGEMHGYRLMLETQARTVGDPLLFILLCWLIGPGVLAAGIAILRSDGSVVPAAYGSPFAVGLVLTTLGGLICVTALAMTVRAIRRRRSAKG